MLRYQDSNGFGEGRKLNPMLPYLPIFSLYFCLKKKNYSTEKHSNVL